MNHGNGKNIIEPAGNSGIDPETAANDIRAILDAGGKGAGILAQRGALLEWVDAIASYHKMDYLLTWNCNHLANANKKKHLRRLNERLRLNTPEIITPLELMDE
jgi:hypothetical protein